jgi:sugar porter (SP) family MFS transporter
MSAQDDPEHWPQVNRGFIFKISSIAALGGVLYGYDMGIIAAAALFVKRTFALSTVEEELVVSIVLVGAMVGALAGGAIADRIGRRATLVWASIIFVIGSLLAPVSPNVVILIIARAIIGLGIGFTSVTAPVYVSELAPPQSRGMLIGLYQLALTIGIALADLVGYLLSPQEEWRLMFGIAVVPTVLFLAVILTVPESPRWLFAHDRQNDAQTVLRSYTDAEGVQRLLRDIEEGLKAPIEQRWAALWSPQVRGAVFIAAGFTILQQVTGINAIIYFAGRHHERAGNYCRDCAGGQGWPEAVAVRGRQWNDVCVVCVVVGIRAQGIAWRDVRHNCPSVTAWVHRLLCIEFGSHRMDFGIGSVPSACPRTGRSGGHAGFGNCELRPVADLSIDHQRSG